MCKDLRAFIKISEIHSLFGLRFLLEAILHGIVKKGQVYEADPCVCIRCA